MLKEASLASLKSSRIQAFKELLKPKFTSKLVKAFAKDVNVYIGKLRILEAKQAVKNLQESLRKKTIETGAETMKAMKRG